MLSINYIIIIIISKHFDYQSFITYLKIDSHEPSALHKLLKNRSYKYNEIV